MCYTYIKVGNGEIDTEYNEWEEGCPLLLTQRILLGKWKSSIIWFLATYGTMRYTELQQAFDDATLTQKKVVTTFKRITKR